MSKRPGDDQSKYTFLWRPLTVTGTRIRSESCPSVLCLSFWDAEGVQFFCSAWSHQLLAEQPGEMVMGRQHCGGSREELMGCLNWRLPAYRCCAVRFVCLWKSFITQVNSASFQKLWIVSHLRTKQRVTSQLCQQSTAREVRVPD